MNCSWAALAGEAVFSDRGEIAGHAHLVMPLLPLHGEGDHLDLLWPLVFVQVLAIIFLLLLLLWRTITSGKEQSITNL